MTKRTRKPNVHSTAKQYGILLARLYDARKHVPPGNESEVEIASLLERAKGTASNAVSALLQSQRVTALPTAHALLGALAALANTPAIEGAAP